MSHLISKREIQLKSSSRTLYLFTNIVQSAMRDLKEIGKNYQFIPTLKQSTKSIKIQETLDRFFTLQPNWDSYNAEIISKTAIKTALLILQYLNNEDYIFDEFDINVFPMRDGGIQYEFDTKQTAAELEISPSGEMDFIRYDNEGNILKTISLPIYELSELSSLLEETDHA